MRLLSLLDLFGTCLIIPLTWCWTNLYRASGPQQLPWHPFQALWRGWWSIHPATLCNGGPLGKGSCGDINTFDANWWVAFTFMFFIATICMHVYSPSKLKTWQSHNKPYIKMMIFTTTVLRRMFPVALILDDLDKSPQCPCLLIAML